MSTAIIGGSFDPIHTQHLQIASKSLTDYNLSKIIFVPNYCPPHKHNAIATTTQRIEMLEIAIKKYPKFTYSTYEIDKADISYSITTVKELQPNYLILGEDAFNELDTWNSVSELRSLVKFIVMPRSIAISSSMIRHSIKVGKSISSFVPPQIEKYIINNRLYK